MLFGTAPAAAQPQEPTPPAPDSPPNAKPEEPAPRPPEPPPAPKPPVVAAPPAPVKPPVPEPPPPLSQFAFGSYGRMMAASDLKGQPGRDADLVAHGSRLDEGNYVELELRREDHWKKTNSTTRLVATLGIASPVFHYTGEFEVTAAIRNLYLESKDLGLKGLGVWAGSRMYRGDDIYLLDFWPLDNLNTMGAGASYELPNKRTAFALHGGLNQPATGFFRQLVPRLLPYGQQGQADVPVLNRQRFIGSAKASHILPFSKDGSGMKGVLYAEMHELPQGQKQTSTPREFETLPGDGGFVVGAQLGAFTGKRDTHVNLFFRYASGLAAYGELGTPTQLGTDRTASGAHEVLVAVGGNWEYGPVGVMLGGYVRSFRNASPDLDFHDVDEGIMIARPAVFFGEIAGLALEGSYQALQHGVVTRVGEDGALTPDPKGPLTARLWRVGVIPFLSPAGRGNYSRPQIRFVYTVTFRNQAAKSLYPLDDVFSLRDVEHFMGIGAEWWFNSSSYGG
jgi:hypothetical protein